MCYTYQLHVKKHNYIIVVSGQLYVQKNNNQPIRAAERLIDVVIGQPYEVYESFMEAVKQNNRTDILDMIANSAFQGA